MKAQGVTNEIVDMFCMDSFFCFANMFGTVGRPDIRDVDATDGDRPNIEKSPG